MEILVRNVGTWYKQVDLVLENGRIEGPLLGHEEATELSAHFRDAAEALDKWTHYAKPE